MINKATPSCSKISSRTLPVISLLHGRERLTTVAPPACLHFPTAIFRGRVCAVYPSIFFFKSKPLSRTIFLRPSFLAGRECTLLQGINLHPFGVLVGLMMRVPSPAFWYKLAGKNSVKSAEYCGSHPEYVIRTKD